MSDVGEIDPRPPGLDADVHRVADAICSALNSEISRILKFRGCLGSLSSAEAARGVVLSLAALQASRVLTLEILLDGREDMARDVSMVADAIGNRVGMEAATALKTKLDGEKQ